MPAVDPAIERRIRYPDLPGRRLHAQQLAFVAVRRRRLRTMPGCRSRYRRDCTSETENGSPRADRRPWSLRNRRDLDIGIEPGQPADHLDRLDVVALLNRLRLPAPDPEGVGPAAPPVDDDLGPAPPRPSAGPPPRQGRRAGACGRGGRSPARPRPAPARRRDP